MDGRFTFADNLRAERARRQFTLADLSDRTGISRATLSRFENGTQQPRLDQITAIAKALGVDMADLLPDSSAATAHAAVAA
jgi:transcriptional regulator with XRE-family HTH domain